MVKPKDNTWMALRSVLVCCMASLIFLVLSLCCWGWTIWVWANSFIILWLQS